MAMPPTHGRDASVGRTRAEQVGPGGALLGEGPVWLADEHCLLWVDIEGRRLHRHATGRGMEDTVLPLERQVTAIAPRAGDGMVAATEHGFELLDPVTGALTPLATMLAGVPHLRMNDGGCDARGRFWAGTMAYDQAPGTGTLYRLDPDGHVHPMLGGLTISNGLDWTDDARTLYLIDSRAGGVDAFDTDADTGELSGRRRVVDIPDDPTSPCGLVVGDGMTLDTDGNLWVAIHGAGEVRCISPAGRLLHVVDVAAIAVTSVAFGGGQLDELYITTAATLSPDHPRASAADGALFRCRPGARGRLARPFAG